MMTRIAATIGAVAVCAAAGLATAQSVLWTNALRGPGSFSDTGLNETPVTHSGAAHGLGGVWSECQPLSCPAPWGSNANTTAGYGWQGGAEGNNAIADDFTVPEGQIWKIDGFDFFAYETGAPAGGSSYTAIFIQIYSGVPGAGGTVVWGDMTTNRLASAVGTYAAHRVFSTVVAPTVGGTPTAPGYTRVVYRLRANTPGLELGPGTYWFEAQATASTSFAGPWIVPLTRNCTRQYWANASLNNARQRQTATWVDIVDAGQPAGTGPSVPMEIAFMVIGQANSACPGTGAGACSRADWNEDGVIDFNDFLAFLNDFNAEDPCADLNGDGVVDFNDFLEYLNIYNVGC
jgi:hypothetical protein